MSRIVINSSTINRQILECVDWLKSNLYEEVLSVSEQEYLALNEDPGRISVSIIQGASPTWVEFTPRVKVEVVSKNRYFGVRTYVIVGGWDAVKYSVHDVPSGRRIYEFVGEYASVLSVSPTARKE